MADLKVDPSGFVAGQRDRDCSNKLPKGRNFGCGENLDGTAGTNLDAGAITPHKSHAAGPQCSQGDLTDMLALSELYPTIAFQVERRSSDRCDGPVEGESRRRRCRQPDKRSAHTEPRPACSWPFAQDDAAYCSPVYTGHGRHHPRSLVYKAGATAAMMAENVACRLYYLAELVWSLRANLVYASFTSEKPCVLLCIGGRVFVITSLLAETPAAMFGAAAVILAGLFILFGANAFHRRGPVRPRLAVLERTAVDRTRSIALIRWDDAEYLILVGGPAGHDRRKDRDGARPGDGRSIP